MARFGVESRLVEVEDRNEYMARFHLRDLVEGWVERVCTERPPDPFQFLIDEAMEQRESGGGLVTCGNPWCGMTMPAAQYAMHMQSCEKEENWARCVRCSERVEVGRIFQHRLHCRIERCHYCGEMVLPRMLPFCPYRLMQEAERSLHASRYLMERQQRRHSAMVNRSLSRLHGSCNSLAAPATGVTSSRASADGLDSHPGDDTRDVNDKETDGKRRSLKHNDKLADDAPLAGAFQGFLLDTDSPSTLSSLSTSGSPSVSSHTGSSSRSNSLTTGTHDETHVFSPNGSAATDFPTGAPSILKSRAPSAATVGLAGAKGGGGGDRCHRPSVIAVPLTPTAIGLPYPSQEGGSSSSGGTGTSGESALRPKEDTSRDSTATRSPSAFAEGTPLGSAKVLRRRSVTISSSNTSYGHGGVHRRASNASTTPSILIAVEDADTTTGTESLHPADSPLSVKTRKGGSAQKATRASDQPRPISSKASVLHKLMKGRRGSLADGSAAPTPTSASTTSSRRTAKHAAGKPKGKGPQGVSPAGRDKKRRKSKTAKGTTKLPRGSSFVSRASYESGRRPARGRRDRGTDSSTTCSSSESACSSRGDEVGEEEPWEYPRRVKEALRSFPSTKDPHLRLVQRLWRDDMLAQKFREAVFMQVWESIDSAMESKGLMVIGSGGSGQMAEGKRDSVLAATGGRTSSVAQRFALSIGQRSPEGPGDLTEDSIASGTKLRASAGLAGPSYSTRDTPLIDSSSPPDGPLACPGGAADEFDRGVAVSEHADEKTGAFMTPASLDSIMLACAERRVLRLGTVLAVIRAATKVLRTRRSDVVQRVSIPPQGDVAIFGDLHGQMKDFLHALHIMGNHPSAQRYFLFNGDFIDRGPYGCEVIIGIFALLITFPQYVLLNRGNHEDFRTNTEYGFMAELYAKYTTQASYIHELLVNSFEAMPLMTVLDKRCVVVHGGVPREPCTLSEIEAIGHVRDIPITQQTTPSERLLADLLWNDPVEKFRSRQLGARHQGQGWRSSKRGCGAEYLGTVTDKFLRMNSLQFVIRSHDVKPSGFEIIHGGRSITVFSASNYGGVTGNRGAVALLSKENRRPVFHTWFLKEDLGTGLSFLENVVDDASGAPCSPFVSRQGSLLDTSPSSPLGEKNSAHRNAGTHTNNVFNDPLIGNDEFIQAFYGECVWAHCGDTDGDEDTGKDTQETPQRRSTTGSQEEKVGAAAGDAKDANEEGGPSACGGREGARRHLVEVPSLPTTSAFSAAGDDPHEEFTSKGELPAADGASAASKQSVQPPSLLTAMGIASEAVAASEIIDGNVPSTTGAAHVRGYVDIVTSTRTNDDLTILLQLRSVQEIREMIFLNRYALLTAFNSVDDEHTGVVYKIEWCFIMRQVLDLDLPWYYLCQFFAPRMEVDGIPCVEYVRFLYHFDAFFAPPYRPSWQRHMVQRIFEPLDLPDDMVTAFCMDVVGAGGAGDTMGTANRSNTSQPSNETNPSSSAVQHTTTSSDNDTKRKSTHTGDTDVSTSERSSSSLIFPSPPEKHEHVHQRTSSQSSGGPPLRFRGESVFDNSTATNTAFSLNTARSQGRPSIAGTSCASKIAWWREVLVDFKTFATQIRGVSPTAAALEDYELYSLFRVMDQECVGHVMLGDLVDRVLQLLEEIPSSEQAPLELLSTDELDFSAVTSTGNTKEDGGGGPSSRGVKANVGSFGSPSMSSKSPVSTPPSLSVSVDDSGLHKVRSPADTAPFMNGLRNQSKHASPRESNFGPLDGDGALGDRPGRNDSRGGALLGKMLLARGRSNLADLVAGRQQLGGTGGGSRTLLRRPSTSSSSSFSVSDEEDGRDLQVTSGSTCEKKKEGVLSPKHADGVRLAPLETETAVNTALAQESITTSTNTKTALGTDSTDAPAHCHNRDASCPAPPPVTSPLSASLARSTHRSSDDERSFATKASPSPSHHQLDIGSPPLSAGSSSGTCSTSFTSSAQSCATALPRRRLTERSQDGALQDGERESNSQHPSQQQQQQLTSSGEYDNGLLRSPRTSDEATAAEKPTDEVAEAQRSSKRQSSDSTVLTDGDGEEGTTTCLQTFAFPRRDSAEEDGTVSGTHADSTGGVTPCMDEASTASVTTSQQRIPQPILVDRSDPERQDETAANDGRAPVTSSRSATLARSTTISSPLHADEEGSLPDRLTPNPTADRTFLHPKVGASSRLPSEDRPAGTKGRSGGGAPAPTTPRSESGAKEVPSSPSPHNRQSILEPPRISPHRRSVASSSTFSASRSALAQPRIGLRAPTRVAGESNSSSRSNFCSAPPTPKDFPWVYPALIHLQSLLLGGNSRARLAGMYRALNQSKDGRLSQSEFATLVVFLNQHLECPLTTEQGDTLFTVIREDAFAHIAKIREVHGIGTVAGGGATASFPAQQAALGESMRGGAGMATPSRSHARTVAELSEARDAEEARCGKVFVLLEEFIAFFSVSTVSFDVVNAWDTLANQSTGDGNSISFLPVNTTYSTTSSGVMGLIHHSGASLAAAANISSLGNFSGDVSGLSSNNNNGVAGSAGGVVSFVGENSSSPLAGGFVGPGAPNNTGRSSFSPEEGPLSVFPGRAGGGSGGASASASVSLGGGGAPVAWPSQQQQQQGRGSLGFGLPGASPRLSHEHRVVPHPSVLSSSLQAATQQPQQTPPTAVQASTLMRILTALQSKLGPKATLSDAMALCASPSHALTMPSTPAGSAATSTGVMMPLALSTTHVRPTAEDSAAPLGVLPSGDQGPLTTSLHSSFRAISTSNVGGTSAPSSTEGGASVTPGVMFAAGLAAHEAELSSENGHYLSRPTSSAETSGNQHRHLHSSNSGQGLLSRPLRFATSGANTTSDLRRSTGSTRAIAAEEAGTPMSVDATHAAAASASLTADGVPPLPALSKGSPSLPTPVQLAEFSARRPGSVSAHEGVVAPAASALSESGEPLVNLVSFPTETLSLDHLLAGLQGMASPPPSMSPHTGQQQQQTPSPSAPAVFQPRPPPLPPQFQPPASARPRHASHALGGVAADFPGAALYPSAATGAMNLVFQNDLSMTHIPPNVTAQGVPYEMASMASLAAGGLGQSMSSMSMASRPYLLNRPTERRVTMAGGAFMPMPPTTPQAVAFPSAGGGFRYGAPGVFPQPNPTLPPVHVPPPVSTGPGASVPPRRHRVPRTQAQAVGELERHLSASASAGAASSTSSRRKGSSTMNSYTRAVPQAPARRSRSSHSVAASSFPASPQTELSPPPPPPPPPPSTVDATQPASTAFSTLQGNGAAHAVAAAPSHAVTPNTTDPAAKEDGEEEEADAAHPREAATSHVPAPSSNSRKRSTATEKSHKSLMSLSKSCSPYLSTGRKPSDTVRRRGLSNSGSYHPRRQSAYPAAGSPTSGTTSSSRGSHVGREKSSSSPKSDGGFDFVEEVTASTTTATAPQSSETASPVDSRKSIPDTQTIPSFRSVPSTHGTAAVHGASATTATHPIAGSPHADMSSLLLSPNLEPAQGGGSDGSGNAPVFSKHDHRPSPYRPLSCEDNPLSLAEPTRDGAGVPLATLGDSNSSLVSVNHGRSNGGNAQTERTTGAAQASPAEHVVPNSAAIPQAPPLPAATGAAGSSTTSSSHTAARHGQRPRGKDATPTDAGLPVIAEANGAGGGSVRGRRAGGQKPRRLRKPKVGALSLAVPAASDESSDNDALESRGASGRGTPIGPGLESNSRNLSPTHASLDSSVSSVRTAPLTDTPGSAHVLRGRLRATKPQPRATVGALAPVQPLTYTAPATPATAPVPSPHRAAAPAAWRHTPSDNSRDSAQSSSGPTTTTAAAARGSSTASSTDSAGAALARASPSSHAADALPTSAALGPASAPAPSTSPLLLPQPPHPSPAVSRQKPFTPPHKHLHAITVSSAPAAPGALPSLVPRTQPTGSPTAASKALVCGTNERVSSSPHTHGASSSTRRSSDGMVRTEDVGKAERRNPSDGRPPNAPEARDKKPFLSARTLGATATLHAAPSAVKDLSPSLTKKRAASGRAKSSTSRHGSHHSSRANSKGSRKVEGSTTGTAPQPPARTPFASKKR